MKRFVPLTAIVVTSAGICALAWAYAALASEPPSTLPTLWRLQSPTNYAAAPYTREKPPLTIQSWAGKPYRTPQVVPRQPHSPHGVPLIPFRIHPPGSSNIFVAPFAQSTVPPGVYKTEPYSCIVVVPGPQLDDRSIINPRGGRPSMPIITPDLHFIPYHPQPNR